MRLSIQSVPVSNLLFAAVETAPSNHSMAQGFLFPELQEDFNHVDEAPELNIGLLSDPMVFRSTDGKRPACSHHPTTSSPYGSAASFLVECEGAVPGTDDLIVSPIHARFDWIESSEAYRLEFDGEVGMFSHPPAGLHILEMLIRNEGKPVEATTLSMYLSGHQGHFPPIIRGNLSRKDIDTLSLPSYAPDEPILDQQALEAYRDRLRQIASELESLSKCVGGSESDEHILKLKLEEEQITTQLTQANGKNGKIRSIQSSHTTRARQRIRKALDRGILGIDERMPVCAQHFRTWIPASQNGAFRYASDEAVEWRQRHHKNVIK